MKLPPEFNSWDEVWNEHQLRGKQIRELKARLTACEEALRNIALFDARDLQQNHCSAIARAALKEPSRG